MDLLSAVVLKQARFLFWLAILVSCYACNHATPYAPNGTGLKDRKATGTLEHRLLLIGDAGDPKENGEPVLEALRHYAALASEKTTVIFLGDIVYEYGMPEKGDSPEKAAEYEDSKRRIDAQLNVLVKGNRGIVIPGNHDWAKGTKEGWQRLKNLEAYVSASRLKGQASLVPKAGCPGPDRIRLGEPATVSLIILDIQWWLHADGYPKPAVGPSNTDGCVTRDPLEHLNQLLLEEKDRPVVVAAHHPLKTTGEHGGYFDWKMHLFPLTRIPGYEFLWVPLPGLGSIYPVLSNLGLTTEQHLAHPRYKNIRDKIEEVFEEAARHNAAPLVYAAGHDHSLQVFDKDEQSGTWHLVSGLGSSQRPMTVRHNDRTLFAHSSPANAGFMVLDFYGNGEVVLTVIETAAGEEAGNDPGKNYKKVFSRQLTRERREPAKPLAVEET